MILLDAYALIAYLRDEPAAESVQLLLATGGCAITAVNLAEVLDVLVRMLGREPDEVMRAPLQLGLTVMAVGEPAGIRAGRLRAAHYRPRVCEVSLADCILAAMCGEDDRVATSDPALADLLRAESIGLLALPDSSGALP